MENGTISDATEILEPLRHRLLLWMLSGPPPQQAFDRSGCAPNEWHEGSLLILGSLPGAGAG
jgi:hypothetical protein